MKKLLFALTALFIYSGAQAQDEDSSQTGTAERAAKKFYHTPYKMRNSGSYDKKAMLLSLSYGFPNTLYSGDYIGYSYYDVSGPGLGPVMLRFEAAIHDEVGIAIFGQVAAKSWSSSGYNQEAVGFGGGVLGIYHLNKWIPISKLDVYAGIGVDVHHDIINHVDYSNYSFTTPGAIVNPAGVLGARYYFSKFFGVFAEFGDTGFSYANAGITWHMSRKGMPRRKLRGSEPRKAGPGE